MFDFKNMSSEELKQLSKDIRIEIDNRMINIKNIKAFVGDTNNIIIKK